MVRTRHREKALRNFMADLGPTSARPRQLADLYRSARLEYWIARQQGFCLFEAVGIHPNVACQVPGDRLGRAVLAGADAITDRAAALKAPALPQLMQIGPPGIVVSIAIIVHQKDVVGHGGLPMLRSFVSDPRQRGTC